MNPHRRPDVLPHDRFEVLQIMRMQRWSITHAADRFVLHENTVGAWQRMFRGDEDVGGLFGPAPFNRIGDAVRWIVHELRRVSPHLAVGSRTIARMILQAGLLVSRSSVQRILREKKPKRKARAAILAGGDTIPYHVLLPRRINRTWHLDLTVVRVLWFRFHIAALVDGFSRKLLVLRVYARTPTWRMMAALVRRATEVFGKPRFLVTDHGCQFRERFKSFVENLLHIDHVQGQVRSWTFNGKVERFFRTFKLWWRLCLFAWAFSKERIAARMQTRLDVFRDWYNARRGHHALDGWTPEQAWSESGPPTAIAIRAHEPQPVLSIRRHRYRGDAHLPDLEIDIDWSRAA